MITVIVGTSRKTARNAKNGSRPRYRPTEMRRPVPRDCAVVVLS
jgi:hypothetical protein